MMTEEQFTELKTMIDDMFKTVTARIEAAEANIGRLQLNLLRQHGLIEALEARLGGQSTPTH